MSQIFDFKFYQINSLNVNTYILVKMSWNDINWHFWFAFQLHEHVAKSNMYPVLKNFNITLSSLKSENRMFEIGMNNKINF